MVQIKFEQKLWTHFFKVLPFWYQLPGHFKNVDCSTSSLLFAKLDFSAYKRP